MACLRTLVSLVFASALSFVTAAPALGTTALLTSHACQQARLLNPALIETACGSLTTSVDSNILTSATASSSATVKTNVVVNIMSLCNDLSATLSNAVNSVTNVSAGLFGRIIVPTLVVVNAQVQASLRQVDNIVACTDASVAAAVYHTFSLFVATQQKIMTTISAHASLWVDLNIKTQLHSTLVDLNQSLETYVDLLFRYISSDLDTLNLRANLFTSIQTAINSCA